MIDVVFVSGLGNDKFVEVVKIVNNFPNIALSGSSNIAQNIEDERLNKIHIRLDLSSKQKLDLDENVILFNQISDSDSHSKVLDKLQKILFKSNIKVINHPRYIKETSRNLIYSKLKNIPNLTVPKTIKFVPITPIDIDEKIEKENFSFPVILRKVGTHGGNSVKLFKSFEDTKKLYDIALDGSPFYLIQFINYKEDGIYKKLRLVVVNGEVYIRHVIFSDEWMIHAKDKKSQYKELEIKLLNSFEQKIKPNIDFTIKQIYKKVRLDYFGIDCFINKNFEITIFELNANMNVLIGASENTFKYVEKIKNAIIEMILKKSN